MSVLKFPRNLAVTDFRYGQVYIRSVRGILVTKGILIEDIPLCFNCHNKRVDYVKSTIVYNYWYLTMATFRSFIRPSSGLRSDV